MFPRGGASVQTRLARQMNRPEGFRHVPTRFLQNPVTLSEARAHAYSRGSFMRGGTPMGGDPSAHSRRGGQNCCLPQTSESFHASCALRQLIHAKLRASHCIERVSTLTSSLGSPERVASACRADKRKVTARHSASWSSGVLWRRRHPTRRDKEISRGPEGNPRTKLS